MAKRKTKTTTQGSSRQGDYLVVILGLARDMLMWTTRTLARDRSQKPATYVGAPSPRDDRRGLYSKNNIAETVTLIDRESRSPSIQRIIVLYIPSFDDYNLITALHLACFLAPLSPNTMSQSPAANATSWRHDKMLVQQTVTQTLARARTTTDLLKAEITDKRTSALTLPAHNFYYPNRHSTISDAYRRFADSMFEPPVLRSELVPSRFTRDELPDKAFKGKQHTDQFFQDCRGRVFPPDPYHAKNHARNRAEGVVRHKAVLSIALLQRYRFGVTARDGSLHYDVQYEIPRKLKSEPMHCAVRGPVLITGSHANVGVNDFIWVPGGTKKIQAKQK